MRLDWTHRAERVLHYFGMAMIITAFLLAAAVAVATNQGIIVWYPLAS